MTINKAKKILKSLDITFKKITETNEYRVNFSLDREATAYYTDDIQDAVDTGTAMAFRRDNGFNEHETASVAKVNKYLRKVLGRDEVLQAGRGYYYWKPVAGKGCDWPSEMIYRIAATNMGYWIRTIQNNIQDN